MSQNANPTASGCDVATIPTWLSAVFLGNAVFTVLVVIAITRQAGQKIYPSQTRTRSSSARIRRHDRETRQSDCMPDCTTEEAEYDLAVIEEPLPPLNGGRAAEADLKYIELQDATANKWTKMMAWWYCLAGGDSGGKRSQNLGRRGKASLRELEGPASQEPGCSSRRTAARVAELKASK